MVSLIVATFLASSSLRAGTVSPAYTFHYHPPVGRRLHYGMKMTMTGAQSVSISGAFTIVATQHRGNRYTIVTTIDSMTYPGASTAQMKSMLAGTKVTQIVDDHGKILSTKAEGPMKAMLEGGGMGSTGGSLPTRPVRVGESWSGISTAVGQASQVRIKLAGVKSVRGRKCGVLVLTPISQNSKIATTNPVTVVVELATGVMQSMELTGGMGAPGGTSASMHVRVQLIS